MHTSKLTIRPYQIFILFAFLFSTCRGLGYSGGTGEPNNPYQIANSPDLNELALDISNYDKCFILTSDINLNPNLPGNQVFTTSVIAYDTDSDAEFDGIPFTGVFDGNGHKITNLTINVNGVTINYIGLFGYIGENAQVKNLTVEQAIIDGNFIGGNYFGGLIGWNNLGDIYNCHSTVVIMGSDNAALDSVGGLVGLNFKGNIRDSYSVNVISGYRDLGGLVGYNNDGDINNCYAISTINSKSSSVYPLELGGLVGSNHGRINKCYSSGNVNLLVSGVYSDELGGLVGSNYGSITECYSMSDVNGCASSDGSSVTVLGGLVGFNHGDISNSYSTGNVYASGRSYVGYLGGLVGDSYCGSIIDSYSTGTVTFSGEPVCSCIGGLVGYMSPGCGSIIGGYFLETSGTDNGLGEPLNDAQMKQLNSFVGWDFVCETMNGTGDIWWIKENIGYPELAWHLILGDFDYNKSVNFADFAILGLKWRQTDAAFYCGGMDLTGDGLVNLNDLAVFAEKWLIHSQ